MISIYLALPAFVVGVIFLYKGSDILVDGTSKAAAQLGISALIISVILVGFGTSAPEFAISVGAAVQTEPNISLGNIIGSCIANLLLVLGISAIIRPMKIKKGILKREMPILLGATVILLISSYFGLLDEHHIVGGIFFVILFSLFIYYFICCAKQEKENKKFGNGSIQKNIFFIILGIAGVVLGAYLLIESAITIADFLRIDRFIIGVSLVAIGTSLPELVVSSMAAYKKRPDIAVGNVLGSNVFNILLILGIAAIFIPLKASESLDHIIFLLIITIAMFPILDYKYDISRIKGVLLLVMYSFFIWYIFFM